MVCAGNVYSVLLTKGIFKTISGIGILKRLLSRKSFLLEQLFATSERNIMRSATQYENKDDSKIELWNGCSSRGSKKT